MPSSMFSAAPPSLTLKAAAEGAKVAAMPYQRGQFWLRRFRQQVNAMENYYDLINVPLEIESDGFCAIAQARAA